MVKTINVQLSSGKQNQIILEVDMDQLDKPKRRSQKEMKTKCEHMIKEGMITVMPQSAHYVDKKRRPLISYFSEGKLKEGEFNKDPLQRTHRLPVGFKYVFITYKTNKLQSLQAEWVDLAHYDLQEYFSQVPPVRDPEDIRHMNPPWYIYPLADGVEKP